LKIETIHGLELSFTVDADDDLVIEPVSNVVSEDLNLNENNIWLGRAQATALAMFILQAYDK